MVSRRLLILPAWNENRLSWTLLGLIGMSLLLRLVALSNVQLIPEEAYYWMYSQHPQLSYFDHPPMVAWVIRLGTIVFGHCELGVRIVGNLLMFGASVLLYRASRLWFARNVSLGAAALLHVLPIYFAIGFIAPMDASLIFSWALCFYAACTAVMRGSNRHWYLAGLALGAGLLTKYSAVALLPSVGLMLLGRREWRCHLRRPHVYLALLLGAAMFTPVVVWNAEHSWASLRFQLVERYAHDRLNLKTPLVWLGLQCVILLPPLIAAVAFSLNRRWRRGRLMSAQTWPFVAFAAPGLMMASYTALRSEVHVNWTTPFWLSLMPLGMHGLLLLLRSGRRRPSGWAAGLRWSSVGVASFNCGMMVFLLTLQQRFGWWSAFGPWHQLAVVVEAAENRLEAETHREPLIIGDGKYRLASVMAFYRFSLDIEAGEPFNEAVRYTTSQWPIRGKGLGFVYWSDRSDWIGKDVVYVTSDKEPDRNLKAHFESVEWINDPRLPRKPLYRLALCRNLLPVSKAGETESMQADNAHDEAP